MTSRGRTLAVGGVLLVVVAAGLVAGFLMLRGNGSSPTPSPPATKSPTPTPTDVQSQVEQAYLEAWEVWADALLRLNPSRLPEAFIGPALDLVTSQVEEQRRKNQPVRIRAEHNYKITILDERTASVDDRYINHNVRLDPETLEPIEPDVQTRVRRSFTFRLVDSTWKIADIIEYR